MAEFPALPLWTDAYLADTRHLTTLQHGAYMLLLMECWRRPTCSLPDDDALLARLCCMETSTWLENKGAIMAFWKLDGRTKTFMQKRLSKEKGYVKKRSKVQRDKAKKRWNKKEKPAAVGYADDVPASCPDDAPTPTPTPTPTKNENIEGGAAKRGTRLPDDFAMPAEWLEAAMTKGLTREAAVREAEKFTNYWQSKAGKDAIKVDWRKTWINWVLRDAPAGGGRPADPRGWVLPGGGTPLSSPC